MRDTRAPGLGSGVGWKGEDGGAEPHGGVEKISGVFNGRELGIGVDLATLDADIPGVPFLLKPHFVQRGAGGCVDIGVDLRGCVVAPAELVDMLFQADEPRATLPTQALLAVDRGRQVERVTSETVVGVKSWAQIFRPVVDELSMKCNPMLLDQLERLARD